jgi:lipid-binding SYLF domain-containing protein
LHTTKGILIIPSLLKAVFGIGGSGGRGVFLVRDQETGQWSEHGFYSMGSVSFGLQIGGEAAEVIMVVRTQKGVDRLLTTTAKLGADTSVTVGPVGAGASTNVVADIVSFSQSKGAYAGLSLNGSIIKVSHKWNEKYYGTPGITPVDIFVKKLPQTLDHKNCARPSKRRRNRCRRLFNKATAFFSSITL